MVAGASSWTARVSRRVHELSRRVAKAILHPNGEIACLGRSKPTWAGPYLSRTCFSNFILEVCASVTLIVIAKEPGNKTWGGGAIRPGRSVRPRVWLKHGGPNNSKDHRSATDAASRRSNVRVVGVVTSGKWLVNLTGEVPLRPPAARVVVR